MYLRVRCEPVLARSARDSGRPVHNFGTSAAMSTTTRPEARPTFNDPGLHQEIMRLRAVDHATNLGFRAIEYGCLAAIIGGAIAFREWRRWSGLSWWWDVPELGLGIVLVGAIQHRLAGLGHEAAHYSLLKNKLLNDLVGDVFCMFPIRLRTGYAPASSPLSGDPPPPAGPAAPAAQGPPSRLRRIRRRVPRHFRQPQGLAYHPRHADDPLSGPVSDSGKAGAARAEPVG